MQEDDVAQIRLFEDYIGKGKYQEVEPLLVRYLKDHPDSWRAHYQLGYVLFRVHKIGASVKALAKSLQLNINNAEAHKILGLDFTIVGKYDEAQIELEQAARLKPDSAEIHYFLGRVHYTKNVFPLAKQEFEAAIRLDPTYVKAYDNLGLTMEPLMDDEAALANYHKAIQLSEQQGLVYVWPYINVCTLYNRKNQPEMALENCRKAIELNPRADEAYFQAARAYMSQRKWDDAAKALETAIEINPRASRLHFVLSTVYRKLGKSEESQKEIATFKKLSQEEVGTFRKMTALDDKAPAHMAGDHDYRAPDVSTPPND